MTKTISIAIQRDGAPDTEQVPATMYGPYIAVTRVPGGATLTHVPTGMALAPVSFRTRWTIKEKRAADCEPDRWEPVARAGSYERSRAYAEYPGLSFQERNRS